MKNNLEKLWTRDFIMLTLCNLLLFLNLQMLLSPMSAYVKDHFHANDLTVSLFTTVFALSAIASRLFSAKALEKGKRNTILFTGLILIVLATFGYLWSGTLALLLTMRVLFGIGFGMGSTTLPTMASGVIPTRRLGEGLGYFGLSTSIALSLGPVIGTFLLDQHGFTTLVYATLGLSLLILPLIYPLSKKVKAPTIAPQDLSETTKQPGFNKSLLLPSLLNMLMSITYGGLLSFLILFGKEAHLANVSLFFLFNVISVIIIRPISGKLYDRKGHVVLLIPAALFLIAGLILLSYSTTTGFLAVAALCYGVGFGTAQPTLQSWMIQSVSPPQQGMANSMYFNSLDLGVAIGALLLGQIASHSNYAMMYRYSSIFLVLFIVIYAIYMMNQSKTNAARKHMLG
ncbi:MFS transporter [Paenibacillus macquariensis]|uniref:Predicted arabinose efflux permease, MFS family n=1 Tax=Paenibacillus macquariensis TaxID=948756 RepID=A0ABY1JRG5_9BACL|nr:MFS transporter [Paenibacillus macquariensis]MEC0092743.1 MFS transporter [Paenibacillus macquariensis]OAB36134.1 MFS transporter [Paenibacillus macquariensis subsp. macquariensis]SIQ65234.1 Predicted arabinose efflux permease, MFS family [Paenibacillus macquariensis]